jgi:uncharacterized membrane protein YeaQ/YmgE (transglycosylase-associated protein family)
VVGCGASWEGGWLAGQVMKGGGYGVAGDVVVGLIGAVVGRFIFGLLVTGTAGSWGSIVVAFLGACLFIAIFRFLGFGRSGI